MTQSLTFTEFTVNAWIKFSPFRFIIQKIFAVE